MIPSIVDKMLRTSFCLYFANACFIGYVQTFYDKLQERLDIHDYHKLIEAFNEFDEVKNTAIELYNRVSTIFGNKYQDLAEEFLTFLTLAQAKSVGKLVPYLLLSNMSLFLHKLEIYFKEQPAHIKKIYKSLSELSEGVDVTMEKIKSVILPLLKGHNLLIEWFLQVFPCEKPPDK